MAYLWLPVFAIIIFICSYFERFRFILFLTIGAATYKFILQQLTKKSTIITFDIHNIQMGDIHIPLSALQHYYISQPLNHLIILRVRTRDKNLSMYIEKQAKDHIEMLLKTANIPSKKIPYDNYLQFGHLILPFVGLAICAIAYKLCDYVQYIVL